MEICRKSIKHKGTETQGVFFLLKRTPKQSRENGTREAGKFTWSAEEIYLTR